MSFNLDSLFHGPGSALNRVESLWLSQNIEGFDQFLEEQYGFKIKKMWLMAWGYRNLNFMLITGQGKRIARLSQRAVDPEEIEFEIVSQNYLAKKGLTVRQTVMTKDGFDYLRSPQGRVLQVVTFLESESPQRFNQNHVVSSGRLLAELHQASSGLQESLPGKLVTRRLLELPTVLASVSNAFARGRKLTPPELARKAGLAKQQSKISASLDQLGQLLDDQQQLSSTADFIHGDFIPLNLTYQGDQVTGVYDFENAGFGFYLWDIGRAAAHWSFHANAYSPQQLLSWLVKGYTQIKELPSQHLAWLPLLAVLGVLERLGNCFLYYPDYKDDTYWLMETGYFLKKFGEFK